MDFLSSEAPRLDGVAAKSLLQSLASLRAQLGFRPSEPAVSEFRELLRNLGLVETLRAAGVNESSDIAHLAESVDSNRLGNSPIPITHSDLVKILEASWD